MALTQRVVTDRRGPCVTDRRDRLCHGQERPSVSRTGDSSLYVSRTGYGSTLCVTDRRQERPSVSRTGDIYRANIDSGTDLWAIVIMSSLNVSSCASMCACARVRACVREIIHGWRHGHRIGNYRTAIAPNSEEKSTLQANSGALVSGAFFFYKLDCKWRCQWWGEKWQ